MIDISVMDFTIDEDEEGIKTLAHQGKELITWKNDPDIPLLALAQFLTAKIEALEAKAAHPPREPLYKVVIKDPEVRYYKEKLLTGEMLSQEYPGAYSLVVEEAAADLDAAVSVQNGNIKKTFTRIR